MPENQYKFKPIPDYFSTKGELLCYRIDSLQKTLTNYEKKLDILQRDATELTAAYEQQSASIESDLDSKIVFQSILDHKLNQEDLTLVLVYIKTLFGVIEGNTDA